MRLNIFKKFKENLQMYDYFLACSIRGKILLQSGVDRGCYSLGKDFIQGNNSISVFYAICGFGRTVRNGLIDVIRSSLEYVAEDYIRINTIASFTKHDMDWGSRLMQLRLNAWKNREEDVEESANVYNLSSTYDDSEEVEWLRESLGELYLAEKKYDRDIIKLSYVLNVVTEDISPVGMVNYENCLAELEKQLKSYGFSYERIGKDLGDYIKTSMPFNYKQEDDKKIVVSKNLYTDILYAKTMGLSHGKVGDTGIYLVTDIYSGKSIFKQFKRSETDLETILVTAEAGGGKSYAVKNMVIMLLSTGHYGTINDIEGDEYTPLADWIGADNPDMVKVINMRKGLYIDPFPIPDLVGDDDIDSGLRTQSIEYITFFYKSIIGDKLFAEEYWADDILDEAINEVYRRKGVSKNPKTWVRSKNCSVKDILPVLEDAIHTGAFKGLAKYIPSEDFKRVCSKMCVKLNTYLAEDGLRADFFNDAISLDEINDAKLVIISFNMKNITEDSVDPVQMKIMQLSAAILSYQRSIYCKYVLGKYNFKLWEEYQRWGDFTGSAAILGTNVTGGRKLGDIIIIVTNSVASLLYSDRDDHRKIFGNISSFMIGAIRDATVRQDLMARLSVPHLKPELDKIATSTILDNKAGTDSDSYRYAFVTCLDSRDFSVGKVFLPDELVNSKLFKTGVVKK